MKSRVRCDHVPRATCLRAYLRRATIALLWPAALALTLLVNACSDTPLQPAPIQPPPPTPPVNEPPVIESIDVSAQRVEIDTEIMVRARVRDAETAIEQLRFEWTADGGTFSGDGSSVAWRTPKDGATPKDYTVTLTVIETYGTAPVGGARPEHRVTSTSPAVRVHNSPKELGDIAVAFLQKFGDSSVSPRDCLVDFSDSCRGKRNELTDIELNRKHFRILTSSVGTARVSYVAGSDTAEVVVRASYTSRVINCDNWPWAGPCVMNQVDSVTFDSRLPSVYEQGRWWLCESKADELPNSPVSPMMRYFFGVGRER